jgi:hypothetical protein
MSSIDRRSVLLATLLTMLSPAGASDAEGPLTGGKTKLDLRLRAEHVDNDSATQRRDANATTLRARLGFATAAWHGFEGGLEYEGITTFDKLDYNDGAGTSPQGNRPVIADPAGSELNQAWLRYGGIPRTAVQVGRQRLVLDNHRWIGNVGWRQNEQTYDGVVVTNKGLPGTELTYAYVHNVNTVLFTNAPLRGNLVNVSYSPGAWLKATAYGYWLDFEAANAGNRQDNQTQGVRLNGAPALGGSAKLLYTAEYARQSEFEEASAAGEADYLLGELGAALGAVTLKVGYEVLGSNDGLHAVQTPLATLHAHDGWADLFLVTPATGLRDAYVNAGAMLANWTLAAAFHRFEADHGGADYGIELDASAGYAFTPQLAALVKYAGYDATAEASFAGNVDTEKGWLQLEYKF